MSDTTTEKKDDTTQVSKEETTTAKSEDTQTSQDPIETELNKVRKEPKTEAEKAAFSLKKNAERAKALGLDPKTILGIQDDEEIDEDDNAPVTVGMLKKRDAELAQKSSLQLADEISDQKERELTKHYLENNIRSTGNPAEDLRLARAIVNSVKNGQIVEDAARKTAARSSGSGSGAPAKGSEGVFEPTPVEQSMMRAPFNLTKEQVLNARKIERETGE